MNKHWLDVRTEGKATHSVKPVSLGSHRSEFEVTENQDNFPSLPPSKSFLPVRCVFRQGSGIS